MRLFPIALVLLLAWGAFAIGGSPSWSAVPVAVFSVATGLLGLIESRGSIRHRPVILALLFVLAAIGTQLVTLPKTITARLSPARDVAPFESLLAVADRRDLALVPTLAPDAARPISIAPFRTWWGLGFVTAFSFLLIGATHALSSTDATRITRAVVVMGALAGLLGIYQTTSGTAIIYGLYVPLNQGYRSAPFINRNHQAGWLVMVMALALGSFAGEVARSSRGFPAGWRQRMLWFSTKEANQTLLLLFAAAVMGIGTLTVRSRSGAAILLLTITIFALWSWRQKTLKASRRVIVMSLAVLALIVVYTSASGVYARIIESWGATDPRVAVWRDSVGILQEFWVTGTGFNTYGTAMLYFQTVRDGFRYIEAHNDYLQLAVEGGLLVGIPVLVLAGCLVKEIRSRFIEGADDTRTYWLRVGAVAGLIAIAAQSLLDFTLQMSGAAVMFTTLLAIAIHHPAPRPAYRSSRTTTGMVQSKTPPKQG